MKTQFGFLPIGPPRWGLKNFDSFALIFFNHFENGNLTRQKNKEMITCFDIDYQDPKANAAAVLFEHWAAESPAAVYSHIIPEIAPYESGSFYKRELPCIVSILKTIKEEIHTIVVDGYVWLDGNKKPGLGAYLFRHLGEKTRVIGVAKNRFKTPNSLAVEVFRGESKKPLFVTAAGMDVSDAVDAIRQMHGEFRIPDLLKRVDMLCRDWESGIYSAKED